jgi:hypothetical protein
MKEVLFYISKRDDAEKKLMAAVEDAAPKAAIKVYRTTEALRKRLLLGGSSALAVVVLASTKQNLLSLMPLRELLLGFRVIMILPDADEVTLAVGWGMWPRFVSYADSDFHDVAGVLKKIAGTATHTRRTSRRWDSAR